MSKKPKKISVLSIDRSHWAVPKNLKKKYGTDNVDPALLCERKEVNSWGAETGETKNCGMKCCLGFLASALGFEDKDILGVTMPSDLKRNFPNRVDSLYVDGPKGPKDDEQFRVNDFESQAALLNDSSAIRPAAKEAKLKKLFSEVGIKLTFRGKYLDDK